MRFKSNTAGHLTRSLARPRAAVSKQVGRFWAVAYMGPFRKRSSAWRVLPDEGKGHPCGGEGCRGRRSISEQRPFYVRMSEGGVRFAGMNSSSKVTWSLAHDSGDTYRLTNTGDAHAVGVAVSAHESLSLIERHGGPDLGPGEALTFMAAIDMGTTDTTITVTWHEPSDRDADKTWRYPLPAR